MEKKIIFNINDLENIRALGYQEGELLKQLAIFKRGASYLKLDRPCIVDDGIISLTSGQRKKIIDLYDKEAGNYKLIKFVPASGAASRMFADWFPVMGKGSFGSAILDKEFFRDVANLPFFPLIKKDKKDMNV